MKKRISIIILSFAVISLAACTTSYNKLIKKTETTFYQGKYKEAAREFLPLINEESNDQLLFMMECGLMLHAAGDFENSNKILLDAAKLADKIATSVSKQAAALLLNETKTNYKGEDFERVLIHMYLGINFLMLNKPDEARVEFKRVNDLLRDISVTEKKNYKQNIMAKYLTAVAFEVIADIDNDEGDREFAYIEYKQIRKLAPKLALVHRDLQRLSKQLGDSEDYNKWVKAFKKKYAIPRRSGELIMIYQAGQGAIKASRGSALSDRAFKNSITVSFAGMPPAAGVTAAGILLALKTVEHPIPKFRRRSNRINHLIVNVNGKDMGRTYMLENIAYTAVRNMADNYNRMMGKVAASIVTKAIASVAAGIAAKKLAEQSKKLGNVAGLIGTVVGMGAGVALVSQIKPDLRCWHTLPSNLQIGRFYLPPGKHNILIKFVNNSGRVERTQKGTVEIKRGKKTFMNYRTLY